MTDEENNKGMRHHPIRSKNATKEPTALVDLKWFHDALIYMWNMVLFALAFAMSLYVKLKNYAASIFKFAPEENVFDISEDFEDIFGSQRGGNKFLNVYTKEDITALVRQSPLASILEKLGYTDWYVEFDLSDSFTHYGYIKCHSFPSPDQFLAFIICQVGEYIPKSIELPFSHINMLNIRWLSLQNPYGQFKPDRPRLPGQRYPGTGLAKDSFLLFLNAAIKQGRDGIVNMPEHFHNAYGYKHFLFLNPEHQGLFERMVHDLSADLKNKGLAMVSWAIFLGFMKHGHQKYTWEPMDQAYPISKRVSDYFKSRKYKQKCKETYQNSPGFTINWELAEGQCLSGILNYSEKENSISLKNI